MLLNAHGRPLIRTDTEEPVVRYDRWQNGLTGIGTSIDKSVHGRFFPVHRVLDQELTSLHNGSDLAAKIVDQPPEEMFRRGYDIEADDIKASETTDMREFAEEYLDLDNNLVEGMRWGRLYGGELGILNIEDGQDPWMPLDEENIRSFSGMALVDRRYAFVQSTYSNFRQGRSKYGKPEIYLVSNAIAGYSWGEFGIKRKTVEQLKSEGADVRLVHESRVIRFEGNPADVVTRQQLAGWSWSVLQRVYDAMRQFEHSFDSVGHLLADASQGVFTLQGLIKAISSGNRQSLADRIQVMEMTRSSLRGIAVDAGTADGKNAEKFERIPTPFGGIPELLDRMMHRLAAAANRPVTVLFGRAPAGLNATGEADIRSWYDSLATDQTKYITPKLQRIYRLLALSKSGPLGGKDIKFKIHHRPLWSPTDDEISRVRLQDAQRSQIYIEASVVSPEEVAVDLEDVYPNLDVEKREKAMKDLKTFDPHAKDPKPKPGGPGGPGVPGAPGGATPPAGGGGGAAPAGGGGVTIHVRPGGPPSQKSGSTPGEEPHSPATPQALTGPQKNSPDNAKPKSASEKADQTEAGPLDVPPVRQQNGWGCGAAAALSVLQFWARAMDQSQRDLYGPLNTTPKNGTDPQAIARYLTSVDGLIATYRENVTAADLEAEIEAKRPVIVAIQAWPDVPKGRGDWATTWNEGHYVIVVGHKAGEFNFIDPASGPASMGREEFLDRWHDVVGSGLEERHAEHQAIFTRLRETNDSVDFSEAALAIVRDREGQILTVSRPEPGHEMAVPGGLVDPGETPEQAAIRELAEETGVVVSGLKHEGVVTSPKDGRTVHIFSVAHWEGTPKAMEVGTRIAWMHPQDLLNQSILFRSITEWMMNRDLMPQSSSDRDDAHTRKSIPALVTWRQDAKAAGDVFEQLLDDYPAKELGWILSAHWDGPVAVPIDLIDFSGRKEWRASYEDIQPYIDRIKGGKRKPVILVKTPNNPKYIIVDGHHRAMAYEKMGEDAVAYIAEVHTEKGPWDELHSSQKKGSSKGTSSFLPSYVNDAWLSARGLTRRDAYDPGEERDETGKWTSGGGAVSHVEGKRTWTEKLPASISHDETWKAHYDKHPDKGGKPSAERVRTVHEPIIAKALDVKPPPKGEQKLAIMTMGAPASGKSSALRGVDTSKYVKVDPDSIKEQLPEYQRAISDRGATYKGAALMAHEESSHIAKTVMARAIANGNHIIVDGTGADEKKFMSKMQSLKDAGYHVHVAMPHLDEETGIARMKDRADKTGRMVPEQFARDAYKSIPAHFEHIARAADSFALVDNAPKGGRLVWEGGKGQSDKIHDPKFVSEFRAKYGGGKGDSAQAELLFDQAPPLLPPDHKPYIVLADGGDGAFSCARCSMHSEKDGQHHCSSPGYARWSGGTLLKDKDGETPLDDPSRACSDWFEPAKGGESAGSPPKGDAGWDESQHPRVPAGSAGGGEFGEGGGGGSTAKVPSGGASARSAVQYFKADPARLERVHKYTASAHGPWNAYLRDPEKLAKENGARTAEMFRQATEAFARDLQQAPKSPGDVLRGAMLRPETLAQFQPGHELSARGFWSTTQDKKIAQKFTHQSGHYSPSELKSQGRVGVLMHIVEHSGVAIGAASSFPKEHEIIIPHGARFRVDRVRHSGGITHVEMSEL